jgi:hypothetical protein
VILYNNNEYIASRAGSYLEFYKNYVGYENVYVQYPKVTVEHLIEERFVARYMLTFRDLSSHGSKIKEVDILLGDSYVIPKGTTERGANNLVFFITQEGDVYLFDGGLVLRVKKTE